MRFWIQRKSFILVLWLLGALVAPFVAYVAVMAYAFVFFGVNADGGRLGIAIFISFIGLSVLLLLCDAVGSEQ